MSDQALQKKKISKLENIAIKIIQTATQKEKLKIKKELKGKKTEHHLALPTSNLMDVQLEVLKWEQGEWGGRETHLKK